jgi:hypothetical protein
MPHKFSLLVCSSSGQLAVTDKGLTSRQVDYKTRGPIWQLEEGGGRRGWRDIIPMEYIRENNMAKREKKEIS